MSYIVHTGNCLDILPTLPERRVQCCVTSPPYYGLRDYGHDDQIGLEQTPAEYVAALVAVFREVWRVLADDGVLWLNLGDSYNGSGGAGGDYGIGGLKEGQPRYPGRRIDGLKPKDLIGIPWRVAFALQADGWYLRSDVIWHKPNPMPESVQDRPTKAHEYLFLLTKRARYYYDADAIAEKTLDSSASRYNYQFHVGSKEMGGGGRPGQASNTAGFKTFREARNKRSVWSITTQPYAAAHFATMPPALVEPCILAGSRKGEWILDPFAGSGTVGAVAIQNGRDFVGCELNPDYVALAYERIQNSDQHFREIIVDTKTYNDLPLFSEEES